MKLLFFYLKPNKEISFGSISYIFELLSRNQFLICLSMMSISRDVVWIVTISSNVFIFTKWYVLQLENLHQ